MRWVKNFFFIIKKYKEINNLKPVFINFFGIIKLIFRICFKSLKYFYLCFSTVLILRRNYKRSSVFNAKILSKRFRIRPIRQWLFRKLKRVCFPWDTWAGVHIPYEHNLTHVKKDTVVFYSHSAKKLDFDYHSVNSEDISKRDLNDLAFRAWRRLKVRLKKPSRRKRKILKLNKRKFRISNLKKKRALIIARRFEMKWLPGRIAKKQEQERQRRAFLVRLEASIRDKFKTFPPDFIEAVVKKDMAAANPPKKRKKIIRPIFNKLRYFERGWGCLCAIDYFDYSEFFTNNETGARSSHTNWRYYKYRKSYVRSSNSAIFGRFKNSKELLRVKGRNSRDWEHKGYAKIPLIYPSFLEKYRTKFYWSKYARRRINVYTGSFLSHMFYNSWTFGIFFYAKPVPFNNDTFIFNIDSKKAQKLERPFYTELTPYSTIIYKLAYKFRWFKLPKGPNVKRQYRTYEEGRQQRILLEIISIAKTEDPYIRRIRERDRKEREEESISLYGRYDPAFYY